jgi:RimJ/RimL family protein N-acetyltransferase
MSFPSPAKKIGSLRQERLISMKKNKLRLREVKEEDGLLLWDWVNDGEVRRASRSSGFIPREEHLAWFRKKLQDPACSFFIAMDTEDRPVGQVRLDLNPRGEVEINVSIHFQDRGLGYGSRLIAMAVQRVFRKNSVAMVHAYIKSENKISRQAFEGAHFKLLEIKKENGIKLAHYYRVKNDKH